MQIPMPTDPGRARFTSLEPGHVDLKVKPMFGNLGASVNGNMFMGLVGDDIGMRLPEDARARLLAEPGAAAFDPPQRQMGGYISLPVPLDRPTPKPWIQRSLDHIAALRPSLPRSNAVVVDITTYSVIDRPVEDGADYVADPSNAPEGYANIASVEWITLRCRWGSRVAFVARSSGGGSSTPTSSPG